MSPDDRTKFLRHLSSEHESKKDVRIRYLVGAEQHVLRGVGKWVVDVELATIMWPQNAELRDENRIHVTSRLSHQLW